LAKLPYIYVASSCRAEANFPEAAISREITVASSLGLYQVVGTLDGYKEITSFTQKSQVVASTLLEKYRQNSKFLTEWDMDGNVKIQATLCPFDESFPKEHNLS